MHAASWLVQTLLFVADGAIQAEESSQDFIDTATHEGMSSLHGLHKKQQRHQSAHICPRVSTVAHVLEL
eukprot:605403-Pelagomonas_calceolata.AAC.1